MSPFHFCLSAARNLSSFQLLPASLIADLLQLFVGLPLFLFPWRFQSRAAFGTSPSSFLNVWPIHLNFLFLISKFISSCPVAFHRSLLEIIFGHHIYFVMYLCIISAACSNAYKTAYVIFGQLTRSQRVFTVAEREYEMWHRSFVRNVGGCGVVIIIIIIFFF